MAKEYDNSAFYYFVISILGLYAVPMSLYMVYRIYQSAMTKDKSTVKARTQAEAKKLEDLQRRKRDERNPFKSVAFYVHLVFLLISWGTIIYMFSLIGNETELAGFNPFTILELEPGASDSQIRRAYRKMSLKYHPDKTQGDQAAQDRFILISKAYGALTDPVARENYEKYGNPDGRQPMEFGIGLPKWLLDEKNKTSVLMMYLMGLVILVPAVVICWYRNSRKYASGEVMQKTIELFMRSLPGNLQPNEIPSLVAQSEEYVEKLKPSSRFMGEMARLQTFVDADRPRKDLKIRKDLATKDPRYAAIEHATVLLYSWFNREKMRYEPLQKDLRYTVTTAHWLLDTMLKIAVQKHLYSLQHPNVPRPTPQLMRNIAHVMQLIVQRMSWNDSELLQLPHFTAREAKHATKGRKGASGIADFLEVPDDEKKGLRDFTEDQCQDVLELCRALPRLDVDAAVVVEGAEEDGDVEIGDDGRVKAEASTGEGEEKEGEEGKEEEEKQEASELSEAPAKRVTADRVIGDEDVCTLRLRITRRNVAEGDSAPPVHAPEYPTEKKEKWYLLLLDKSGQIVQNLDEIESQDRVVEHTSFKWRAPPAGDYKARFLLLSDSYVGFDRDITVHYRVVPQSEVPVAELNQDDLEFDKELEQELHEWEDNDDTSSEEGDAAAEHEDESSDDEE